MKRIDRVARNGMLGVLQVAFAFTQGRTHGVCAAGRWAVTLVTSRITRPAPSALSGGGSRATGSGDIDVSTIDVSTIVSWNSGGGFARRRKSGTAPVTGIFGRTIRGLFGQAAAAAGPL